jgi:hypothetical protein
MQLLGPLYDLFSVVSAVAISRIHAAHANATKRPQMVPQAFKIRVGDNVGFALILIHC